MADAFASPATPPPRQIDEKVHLSNSVSGTGLTHDPHGVRIDGDGHVVLSPPPSVNTVRGLAIERTESPELFPPCRDETQMQGKLSTYMGNTYVVAPKLSQTSSIEPASDLHGLYIRTDLPISRRSGSSYSVESEGRLRQSISSSNLPRRAPSIRAHLHSSAGSLSPGSVISSPQIAAMLDITPLPSPTLAIHDQWGTLARTRSRGSSVGSKTDLPTYFPNNMTLSPTSPARRKGYPNLRPTSGPATPLEGRPRNNHSNDPRDRSVSDYVPEAIIVPKPRNIAVSSAGPLTELTPSQANLHREEYLADTRGLTTPDIKVPSAPPIVEAENDIVPPPPKRAKVEIYRANTISGNQPRSYVSIRQLGQGTFSKVYLAVKQINGEDEAMDHARTCTGWSSIRKQSPRLVAVKVVEQGPAGGADAERIEVSLQREVEIMKAVKHPSLVHLKAFGNSESHQALLVMNYCPGGDLFDLASTRLDLLTPAMIRRIFAELVSAVHYLHSKYIVHRDVKLENVLLNVPSQRCPEVGDWQALDIAVVTLTDLGLSRRISPPPESPLLTTRCGSEDYAAPELLMGQPYDGRQTDAWAMGVLLYSLMEGRLPFDPLPGARGDPAVLRARTPHRIARVEWAWYRYGDEDGEWDATKGYDLEGARQAVEALLQRQKVRASLEDLKAMEWVRGGIDVAGGLDLDGEEDL